MNQADFLISSQAKINRPVKASTTRTTDTTQNRSDFVSRLDQATAKNKLPSTGTAGSNKRVSSAKTPKNTESIQKTDKSSITPSSKKMKESGNNAEISESVHSIKKKPQHSDNKEKIATEKTSDTDKKVNTKDKSEMDTNLGSEVLDAELEQMQTDDEQIDQNNPLKEQEDFSEDSDIKSLNQYGHSVKETVLNEGEEILSQLNSASRMLKSDDKSPYVAGKQLPQADQKALETEDFAENIVKQEAKESENLTEFTVALMPTKPLLSQLLDKMNATQADADREASLNDLAEKEGLSKDQLALLEKALAKVDVKKLQEAMGKDEEETRLVLENEPALRDAFIIKILKDGQEDPQLEKIFAHLKEDSYKEADADIEKIPPKLMIELSAYVEAKQQIYKEQKAQEEEKSESMREAFILGSGFGAGLAMGEQMANKPDSPRQLLPDDLITSPETFYQSKSQVSGTHRQNLPSWHSLQQMQLPADMTEHFDKHHMQAGDSSKAATLTPELLATQAEPPVPETFSSSSAPAKTDFASQIAGMSSIPNALQDSQLSNTRAVNQQALEAPIKLAQQGQVAPELTDKVNMMLTRDLKQVDIRLDPPELGKVHIKLSLNNDQANLNFTVSHTHARDAIEHSIPRLREMLAQQGVDLGQTNVDQEQSQAFSGMLAGENNGSSSSQSSEEQFGDTDLSAENLENGEEIQIQVASSDSEVDFYA